MQSKHSFKKKNKGQNSWFSLNETVLCLNASSKHNVFPQGFCDKELRRLWKKYIHQYSWLVLNINN